MIELTNQFGSLVATKDDLKEPLPGSILLTEGRTGTAWQRFFSDGRWHPVRGGGSRLWVDLLRRRNVWLVYSAAPRPEGQMECVQHGSGKIECGPECERLTRAYYAEVVALDG